MKPIKKLFTEANSR